MAIPGVTVEIAFASDALDSTPTWSDVTDYVLAFSSSRGRSSIRDKYNAGTCSITLDNTDGRFDAHNTAGAYYSAHALGGIRPQAQVRVESDSKRIFTGWTDRWQQVYQHPGNAQTAVTCKDLMALVAPARIASTTRAAETTEDRFNDLCGTRLALPAAWYTSRYNHQVQMTATTYGVTARAHLTAIENSEAGYAWVSKSGVLTLDGRYSFYKDSRQSDTTYMLEDNPTATPPGSEVVIRYAEPAVVTDTDLLFTEVEASNAGYSRTIQNTTKYAQLGPITGTQATQCLLDRQVDANAQWMVSQYALLSPRIEQVVIDVLDASTDEYDAVLDLELRDQVWLGHTPPGGGDRFALFHNIEAIAHSVTPTSWKTTLTLGDAHRYSFAGSGNWYEAGDNVEPGDGPYPST